MPTATILYAMTGVPNASARYTERCLAHVKARLMAFARDAPNDSYIEWSRR